MLLVKRPAPVRILPAHGPQWSTSSSVYWLTGEGNVGEDAALCSAHLVTRLLTSRNLQLAGRKKTDFLPWPDPARRRKTPQPTNGRALRENRKALLQLRADESVRDGFVRISDQLIQSALAHIARAGRNRAEDLHQVRVTVKRLRALLRLVRPVTANGYFRRENRRLKRTADRLARSRDTTVSRRTLAKLAANLPDQRDQKAFSRVLRRLVAHGPAPGRFTQEREAAMAEAADELREADHSFQSILFPAENWEAIEPGLRKTYRWARHQMLQAIRRDTEAAFHEWRKHVKYLYYQLQTVQPVWSGRLGAMGKQLKRLEDNLGKNHDLAVLEKTLMELPERYGGRRAVKRVVSCLEQQSRKLREQSQALGRKIFAEKPDRLLARLNKRWTAWRG